MGKAKTITDEQLDRLIDDVVSEAKFPERDLVMVLLSFKAGLRACEIAGLTWRDVTDAEGKLTNVIEIPANIAKYGSARTIPMHPLLREALEVWHDAYGQQKIGTAIIVPAQIPAGKDPLILSMGYREQAPMNPNTLQKFLGRLYRRHGLELSSHSGRRTLLTKLARRANDFDCSLFDVQNLAGHRSIATTEEYVELSENAAKMMSSV